VILHREGAARGDGATALPRSVPELGRMLRQERALHGLTIEDVAGRTGLPAALLDAFESGTVDRLPDQVQTIKALRGYAEVLGLNGNDYALALMDFWPSYGGAPPVVVVESAPPSADIKVPAEPVVAAAAVASVAAAGTRLEGDTAMVPSAASAPPLPAAPPEPLPEPAVSRPTASTATRVGAASTVHRVGGTSPAPDLAPGPMILADTGVTPAIPVHHRRRTSTWMRVGLVVLAIALVVGVAGIVVHQVKPSWLHDIGIGSNKPAPAKTASHHTAPPAAFALVHSSPTSATFAVREPSFVVKVVAVGGSTWIQASDAHHVNPIFSGEIPQNSDQLFTVQQSLTLQVGSQNARVFVSKGFTSLGFYFPQVAPFTLVFDRAG
jgi:hypothetical protein